MIMTYEVSIEVDDENFKKYLEDYDWTMTERHEFCKDDLQSTIEISCPYVECCDVKFLQEENS